MSRWRKMRRWLRSLRMGPCWYVLNLRSERAEFTVDVNLMHIFSSTRRSDDPHTHGDRSDRIDGQAKRGRHVGGRREGPRRFPGETLEDEGVFPVVTKRQDALPYILGFLEGGDGLTARESRLACGPGAIAQGHCGFCETTVHWLEKSG